MTAPHECNHLRSVFIASERGPGDRRSHASVCAECGTFRVSLNGAFVTFQLVTDDQVRAAGQYAQYLQAAEKEVAN